MFKKYYKAANDDIKTNRELIDKILKEAEKPSKTVKFAKFYKVGTAIAAVFVLAIGAFLYPQIAKLNKTPDLPAATNQIAGVKEAEQINEGTAEQTPEQETKKQTPQQDNSETAVSEPDPEPVAEVENSEIAVASEDEFQPFYIHEGRSSRKTEETAEINNKEIPFESFVEVTDEEKIAVNKFLVTAFGEKDEDTGNTFIFEIVGKAEGMYLGRWKWFVVDHSSMLCEFVLNEELTEMYDCIFNENNTVVWNTSNNLLNN